MTEIEKLLAILDMTEEEQHKWLYEYADKNDLIGIDLWCNFCITWKMSDVVLINCSIADLAFRLRDEAAKIKNFGEDLDSVIVALSNYICSPPPNCHLGKTFLDYLNKVGASSMWVNNLSAWWNRTAQPIHWIIVSLITKQLAKKQ